MDSEIPDSSYNLFEDDVLSSLFTFMDCQPNPEVADFENFDWSLPEQKTQENTVNATPKPAIETFPNEEKKTLEYTKSATPKPAIKTIPSKGKKMPGSKKSATPEYDTDDEQETPKCIASATPKPAIKTIPSKGKKMPGSKKSATPEYDTDDEQETPKCIASATPKPAIKTIPSKGKKMPGSKKSATPEYDTDDEQETPKCIASATPKPAIKTIPNKGKKECTKSATSEHGEEQETPTASANPKIAIETSQSEKNKTPECNEGMALDRIENLPREEQEITNDKVATLTDLEIFPEEEQKNQVGNEEATTLVLVEILQDEKQKNQEDSEEATPKFVLLEILPDDAQKNEEEDEEATPTFDRLEIFPDENEDPNEVLKLIEILESERKTQEHAESEASKNELINLKDSERKTQESKDGETPNLEAHPNKEKKTTECSSTADKTCDDEYSKIYCLCRETSYGLMVACDDETCEVEWFHSGCVKLTKAPKGKWFCPSCRGMRSNTQKVRQKRPVKTAPKAEASKPKKRRLQDESETTDSD